ncbi:DUF6083 domain-containing protein [Streptomyces chumphonensis]|nr:DUF6083 domain-containing protein [Streptomyces chumphonensis]
MRISPGNASRTLVRDTRDRCRWCGNPVEWRDAFDGGRVPLVPQWFPARRVPARYQWHVDGGVAYLGAHTHDLGRCRIKHSAVCPAVEHENLDDSIMLEIHAALGVAQQRLIRAGFVPAPAPRHESEVQSPDPPNAARPGGIRHILAYCGTLWITPGLIEDLQCIALASSTGERCLNSVFEIDEGHWAQVEIPEHGSRTVQIVLNNTGGLMWVWSLDEVGYTDSARWSRQRCTHHTTYDATPDAGPNELVRFHTVCHADLILAHRPTGYDHPAPQPAERPGGPARQECATDGCRNGTVIKDVAPDWRCYQCEARAKRRQNAQRKWQTAHPAEDH